MANLKTADLMSVKRKLLEQEFDNLFRGQTTILENGTVFKKEQGKYSADGHNSISEDIIEDLSYFTIKDGKKIYTYLYEVTQDTIILDGKLLINGEWTELTTDILSALFEDKKQDVYHPIFRLAKQLFGTSYIKVFGTKFMQYTEVYEPQNVLVTV